MERRPEPYQKYTCSNKNCLDEFLIMGISRKSGQDEPWAQLRPKNKRRVRLIFQVALNHRRRRPAAREKIAGDGSLASEQVMGEAGWHFDRRRDGAADDARRRSIGE